MNIPLANLTTPNPNTAASLLPPTSAFPPTNYTETFQLASPLTLPLTNPICTTTLGWHAFKSSYGNPWVTKHFVVPPNCGTSWSTIVLTLQSSAKGRQFDRIYQVWVNGFELLRGCTNEPTRDGVWWEIRKDVTDLSPVFQRSTSGGGGMTVTVALDNVNDDVYTGVYNTSVSFEFYSMVQTGFGKNSVPDMAVALESKELYPHIVLDGTGKAASFKVPLLPRNILRAELEYYVSYHQSDEFYYVNGPDDSYASPENGIFGGGTYKELQVYIDDIQVGVEAPFQLVYTGANDPKLWKPISPIRSEDFPSYRFDLTPFASVLANGKEHTITLNVTTQTKKSLWFVDGILRLWLDDSGAPVTGTVMETSFENIEPTVQVVKHENGIDFAASTSVVKKSLVRGQVGDWITSISKRIEFDGFVNYTQEGKSVTGWHNIATSTFWNVTSVITGVVRGWGFTVSTYPMTFNFTQIPMSTNGSLYYSYTLYDHAQNVNTFLSMTGRGSSSNTMERHIAEGFVSNLQTLPHSWWNNDSHIASYSSVVLNDDGCVSYGRNVQTVNGTIISDKVQESKPSK